MKPISPQTIQLKLQEQYTITLKGRLMAGYQWISSNDNESIISIYKKTASQKENVTKRIGESSNELFTITALK